MELNVVGSVNIAMLFKGDFKKTLPEDTLKIAEEIKKAQVDLALSDAEKKEEFANLYTQFSLEAKNNGEKATVELLTSKVNNSDSMKEIVTSLIYKEAHLKYLENIFSICMKMIGHGL